MNQLLTQARDLVWSYGARCARWSALLSAAATVVTQWLGGWDQALQALCVFMVLDFLLGVTAAVKAQELDSRVMFWGGVNKLLILVFVAVGARLDLLLAPGEPFCRTAVVYFYIGREGLSLAENYGKLGGRLPQFLTQVLRQLQESGDQGGKEEIHE